MVTTVSFGFLVFIVASVTVSCFDRIEYHQAFLRGERRRACSIYGIPPRPPGRVNTTAKLEALREVMKQEVILRGPELHAYIIPSDDDHQTEYVSDYDKRREYISGFSGSRGDAIVTQQKAALFTDGRYHFQADDQLDCNWLLLREGTLYVPTMSEWLIDNLPKHGRIGVDPRLYSAAAWNSLEYELQNTTLQLVEVEVNLVDAIWTNHSEAEKERDVFVWDIKYAGRSWTDKIADVRKQLRKNNADAMVITSLDEIAWLLNIRGRDIPYTPYVKSYVLLSLNEIILYVDREKIGKSVIKHFNADAVGVTNSTVQIKDYEQLELDLPTWCQAWHVVLVPSACVFNPGVSKKIHDLVPKAKRLLKPSPIIYLKAVKNPTEIRGMEEAHIRDAVAMCESFTYLETFFDGEEWDELRVARTIDESRFVQNLSLTKSFPTIAAFGPHGAQPHYEPNPTTNSKIFANSTLVIDSGGQYFDGTTDVTRTVHFGNPTLEQKRAYTRVLMGCIDLSLFVFPSHLKTSTIDIIARAPLWQSGHDYNHATGHGVGAFLGVHESPILLHYNNRLKPEHLKPGYFLSVEPAFYAEGEYGIRLENVVEVIEKPHLQDEYGHSYLGFKDVTLVPYDRKLIEFSLLSHYHRRWLNDYNARIRTLVGPELKRQGRTDEFYWMMDQTKYIPEHGNANIICFQPLYMAVLQVVLGATLFY